MRIIVTHPAAPPTGRTCVFPNLMVATYPVHTPAKRAFDPRSVSYPRPIARSPGAIGARLV
jgi:hypothetical protein